MIRRRVFIAGLAGSTPLLPFAVRAQQPGRLPTIGYLGASRQETHVPWTNALVQRLRELGWIQGRNLAIEYRWANGQRKRYAEIAAEFVLLKVDVIVTMGPAIRVAQQATSVIPIVFPLSADPVGSGIVESLARPGGNITGVSLQRTDTVGKRIEILRELLPGLRHLAILANARYPQSVIEMSAVVRIARTLGIEVTKLAIRRSDDIVPAFEAIRNKVDALYVISDPLTSANGHRISALALAAQLPTMQAGRPLVKAGGLLSYGADFADLFRRSADMVDKILRGVKPAEIPVEQPTKFDLLINLKTAKALGITVPPTLLARADEVIE